jgi:hypothetical protein
MGLREGELVGLRRVCLRLLNGFANAFDKVFVESLTY